MYGCIKITVTEKLKFRNSALVRNLLIEDRSLKVWIERIRVTLEVKKQIYLDKIFSYYLLQTHSIIEYASTKIYQNRNASKTVIQRFLCGLIKILSVEPSA